MEYIAECISNLLYVSYFLLIGRLLFGFERKHKKYEAIVVIVMVLIASVSWFHVDLIGKVIVHVLSIFLALLVYFREKIQVLFLFYLAITAVLAMLSTMFEMMVVQCVVYMNINTGKDVKIIIEQILLLLYLVILGCYFKRRYSGGFKKIGIGYLLLLALLIVIDAAIVMKLGDFIMNDLQVARRGLMVIMYIGIISGILLQIALLVNALLTRNVHKENEKLAKQFLESQKEHYLYLEKREEETKKFRHDIKNHLLLLDDFMEKKDYENAKVYLGALSEKVYAIGSHISVNNGIVDAILNKYYEDAIEEGIELQVNGHFPTECNVSAFDMCTILSNLLSNAILAERQYGGNYITLNIRYNNEGEILLHVENDYNHELKAENGTFITSKPDAIGHGYGLKNVHECVEKNNGHMSIATEKHRFKVMLSLKMN